MMRIFPIFLLLVSHAAIASSTLSSAEETAAFEASGFTLKGNEWRSACEDPGTPSYTPGKIEQVLDLNGDGYPEALITEGGTFCYGHTGVGFSLVSKQPDGTWKLVNSGIGIVSFLNTSADGWPDIEIGGPGFCFPVERWNGKEYVLHRHEYDGKPCRQ